MCLITYQKKASVAKKDIVCYKAVNTAESRFFDEENRPRTEIVATSKNHNFHWEISVLYKTRMAKAKNDIAVADDTVDEFYFGSAAFDQRAKTMRQNRLVSIGPGFHAFLHGSRKGYRINATCVIPKGSRYYRDATGLITANQMKMTELENPQTSTKMNF